MSIRAAFRSPSGFCQIYSEDKEEHSVLSTDTTRKKVKKPKHTEKEVVKDLLFMIRSTRDAYAIAANQRGFDFPIFVCKYDLNKLSILPFTHQLVSVSVDDLALSFKEDISVFKEATIEIPEGSPAPYRSRERCLSAEGLEYETERYPSIVLHARMLDMEAYRRNRNNLIWREVALPLAGLAAQIVQHEVDHTRGLGIWNFNF